MAASHDRNGSLAHHDVVTLRQSTARAVLDPIAGRARLERMIAQDYRLVWRLLRRLGVAGDAVDDAVQQVFLIAAERLTDIREGSERAFVFGTAIRVAQTARRKVAREPASDASDESASSWPGPDELSDQKRARELLDGVLDALPLDLRTVFVLFEIEGLTSPEIAAALGLPLGTVASKLRRARERFRTLVEERRAVSTFPGAPE